MPQGGNGPARRHSELLIPSGVAPRSIRGAGDLPGAGFPWAFVRQSPALGKAGEVAVVTSTGGPGPNAIERLGIERHS